MAKTKRTIGNMKQIIFNEEKRDDASSLADINDLSDLTALETQQLTLVLLVRAEARAAGIPTAIMDKKDTSTLDLLNLVFAQAEKPKPRQHKYADGTLHDPQNPRPKNYVPPDPRIEKREQK